MPFTQSFFQIQTIVLRNGDIIKEINIQYRNNYRTIYTKDRKIIEYNGESKNEWSRKITYSYVNYGNNIIIINENY